MISKALLHDLEQLQDGEELLFLLKGRAYVVKAADHHTIKQHFEKKRDGKPHESDMPKVSEVN